MTIRRFNIEPLLPLLQQGFTLLTPNNRSVDGILREFASTQARDASTLSGWQRPSVFAIDIYIQQLWQVAASQGIAPFHKTTLLSRFDEQELWLQIVESSFDRYPLLNSEETASSVARSHQFFKQWKVASSDKLDHYQSAVDFQTFLDWSNQFEKACSKNSALSLSDAGKVIITNIEVLRQILPRKIGLINFNQAPPLYAELFEAFSRVSDVSRQGEETSGKQLGPSFAETDAASTNRSYQNAKDEVAECIAWCQDKARQSTQAHIGIIVDPARSLEAPIEEALFKASTSETIDSFDLSKILNRYHSSEKLDETAHFNRAISLLSLNYDLVDSERFCRLLQSSFTAGAECEIQSRIALETTLRKKAEAEIRLSQLRQFMLQETRQHYCPILAAALLEFSELARHAGSHQTLRHWLQLFTKQLQALGWPGTGCTEDNQRLAVQWQQSIQRFSASSAILGNISITKALRKLQTFLKQSNVNLNFDDRLQISMLNIEESQDLVFDHVWVLAADDKNFPQAINPVPFLPYRLQQELGMPNSSNQQQLETAIQQLVTLRKNTAGTMVISHHTLQDELSIRPSALLQEILFDEAATDTDNAKNEDDRERKPAAMARAKNHLERFQDVLHVPLQPDEEILGGTGLLSNQSNCPFRAFARNRLRATALEEFSHGLNPIARGNALHKALENMGLGIGNSKSLHERSLAELQRLVSASAKIATDFLRAHHPEIMTPAFSLLEQKRLSKLLNGFLAVEQQRAEFTILQNEMAVSWKHSKLTLSLRIDRVDQLEDGSLALIDYKTGKHTNYKWLDERPDDMQLPLYQIAIQNSDEKPVSATLIYQLNAENIGLVSPIGISTLGVTVKTNSQAKNFAGDWPELHEFWNKTIYSLVQEFEDGLAAVAPARGYTTCQHCDLGPLCRVAESEQALFLAGEDEL